MADAKEEKEYFARSANADGDKETVKHHLTRVGELCAMFLSELGYSDWGLTMGITHDFGKISYFFQMVLQGIKAGINHALPGAVLLKSMYENKFPNYKLMGAVVASHHSKLKSYSDYEDDVKKSYFGRGENLDQDNREFSLFGEKEYQQAAAEWRKDFKRIKLSPAPNFKLDEDAQLSKMLFERILFSALVDADWSSSAEHFEPGYLEQHTGPKLDATEAKNRLLAVGERKQQESKATPEINQLRDYLFDTCLAAGSLVPGLFTLTAPTGLGKTLSLLAFAIEHCIQYDKRRIILVLPYLSIIEQNSKDYREIIPDLLEIHSNAKLTETSKLLTDRWDAPCIITTNVSFLEPLFSASAGDCRHLHQLANSVIVFDEAQSLPSHLLDATLRTLKLLCDHYKCTVLLSTATQPSFQHRAGLKWEPKEVIPNPAELYEHTRRLKWNWRINDPVSLSDLALELSSYHQCCVIVNTKRHARKIFHQLQSLRQKEEIYYLTTELCPDQRSDELGKIRERLNSDLPCILVATSCVEAGVDIDFPVLYRALAPLESLIQAAGRCNRNGNYPAGLMTVFLPDDSDGQLYPDEKYGWGALCVKILLSRHEIDCNNLKHIEEYYQLLYSSESRDAKELQDAIKSEDYEKVEKLYKIIDQPGVQVIVPYKGQSKLYFHICEMISQYGLTKKIIASAKGITVSCLNVDQVKQHCTPLFHKDWETGSQISTDYYLLENPDFYDEKQGLCFKRA